MLAVARRRRYNWQTSLCSSSRLTSLPAPLQQTEQCPQVLAMKNLTQWQKQVCLQRATWKYMMNSPCVHVKDAITWDKNSDFSLMRFRHIFKSEQSIKSFNDLFYNSNSFFSPSAVTVVVNVPKHAIKIQWQHSVVLKGIAASQTLNSFCRIWREQMSESVCILCFGV